MPSIPFPTPKFDLELDLTQYLRGGWVELQGSELARHARV